MTRSAWCLVLIAACGGPSHHREVARIAAPGDGTCHEAGGCEAPIPEEPAYKLPDTDHGTPDTPTYDPRKTVEASCDDVARNLAALDLGNYADDDKLAPAIAKHRAACGKYKLDKAERQCAFEATDKASVTWCVPRMVPGAAVAVVAPRECPAVIDQMTKTAAPYRNGQPLIDKQIAAMQTSCEQDRWTIAFRDCVRSVPYPGYIPIYCGGAGPAPLRKKLEDRLAQVK
jgi:hypothetical protein